VDAINEQAHHKLLPYVNTVLMPSHRALQGSYTSIGCFQYYNRICLYEATLRKLRPLNRYHARNVYLNGFYVTTLKVSRTI
jgi:hypothetical protein